MAPGDADPPPALKGFATFLQERTVVPARHQPHMVRRIGSYLKFAEAHPGYTFDQTVDLFLAALDKRPSIYPWRLRQASNAVRIWGIGLGG